MKLNLISLSVIALLSSSCNEHATDTLIEKTDTLSYVPITHKKEVTNAEPFFEELDTLQVKIKAFDPTIGELEVMPSDSLFFEAKDAYHNRIWISGANNAVSEISWIWNHDGYQKPPQSAINNFGSITKIMLGQEGKKWVLSELKKKATVEKHVDDTAHIKYNMVTFHNDALTTINLTIKVL